MAPPTRRSRTRPTTPAPEKKPVKSELLIDEAAEAGEKFYFLFQEGGLTAKECAEKMDSFNTKEDFISEVALEEIPRFLTKVMIGRNGQPLKCFICDKVYASSTGFWTHLKKCCIKTESEVSAEAQQYRISPAMWLKVEKKNQVAMLKHIVGTNYTCFSPGCNEAFGSSQELIEHLGQCIKPGYFSFEGRIDEFRKLDKKAKNAYVRDALIANEGDLACLVCSRKYSHCGALIYHIDRCQLEKSAQPWKCWRCGYEAIASESEAHLNECAKKAELKVLEKLSEEKVETSLLSLLQKDESDPTSSTKRRRITGGAPRATARKDGTTLYRFRKSTVNREFNGVVTRADQKNYEKLCSSAFEKWKSSSEEIPFCESLKQIGKSEWKPSVLDRNDNFYRIFTRQSVTMIPEKISGLQSNVPPGIRLESRKSIVLNGNNSDTQSATVAYCGAPVNGIKVAPGKATDGDDVICVTTFANETDFESDSSVVQFWRHRVNKKKSELDLWFLLHIPRRGTILSMTWLPKHDTSEPGLVGFVAFSTTKGQVLVYRIDSTSSPFKTKDDKSYEDVSVIVAEPNLILSLPKSPESSEDSFLNATIKVEGEDVVLPMRIDETSVPLLKIAWSAHDGGSTLVAITALGAISVWNLNENVENPRVNIEDNWQSPPTDIAFLNVDHVVVGFKEKLVKVMNINTWEVKLEDNTVKTAGARVHTDSRIIGSFFTFQSEYASFPYPNATSIVYVSMDIESMMLILIPTGNTHQLMAWDVAICPPLGTLLSCGIDGRLVASATGRLLGNVHHPFFANRNIMSLRRRRVLKEVKTMDDYLKEVKIEGESPATSETEMVKKEPLEESIVEHGEVCKNMWLEVEFDQMFEPTRPELSCRDQRIESLNCVDTTTNCEWPVTFTSGEAGLLFAVSSKLIVKELDL